MNKPVKNLNKKKTIAEINRAVDAFQRLLKDHDLDPKHRKICVVAGMALLKLIKRIERS